MDNLFRKKQEVSKLLFSIIVVFVVVLNACSIEAKSLKKGEVYRSLKGKVIEVISKSELEITEGHSYRGKETLLAEYDFKGDKLRVVANVMGTKMVTYYLLTKEGLADEKTGEVYYTKAALAAVLERQRAEEEKRRAEEEKKRTYTDNGNGTVTRGTGLMWQKEDDNTKRKWEDAISYCKGLSLGGHNDWRLPNIEDLKSINSPTINATYFPNTKASYYWSSTTYANGSSDAWAVGFYGGSHWRNYKTMCGACEVDSELVIWKRGRKQYL